MPPPKNLKVLKLQEGQPIMPIMQGFARGLGVRCDYCHVAGQPPDFASDDNPKKATARMMITMVQDINGKFPDSKEHVTCYTCHRGAAMPLTAPPPPAAPGQ
jgi:Photosynthetic reaction centre cytochrome C subunit